MTIRPSPVIALNRAIAVAQSEGAQRGLEELHAIAGAECMADYPFYYAALGELERRCNRQALARKHFREALARARSPMEQRFLQQRLDSCA
jgi:predicted RNA polymerase sigma factor